MAETRNIKDLPQSDAIAGGDYFLIETTAGTQLLDFDNFVIDQDNTTFAVDLQTNVTSLSTQVDTLTAAVDLTNTDSPVYFINNTLTETINLLTTNLYGESFETVLNETRASLVNDPVTDEARVLDNNMETLSAMIFDSVYSQITAAVVAIRGVQDITSRTGLVYSGGNNSQPEANDGGLLGAVLDTALASIDVYTREVGGTITYGTNAITFTLEIPSKYAVNSGSLQYTVWYSGGTDAKARTDETPYTSPGFFAITDFTKGAVKDTGQEYSWTITRYGGKAFEDMITTRLVTDAAGNEPTIASTAADGTVTVVPNPAYTETTEIASDDTLSFPFTINGRVVVGLNTVG